VQRSIVWTGALFDRSPVAGQIVSRVDERHVAERLRKIPHLAMRRRIVLLRKQSDIVAKSKQALEHRAPFRDTALQDEIVHEPETACEEGRLPRRQTVFRLVGVVAVNEATY